MLRNKNVITSIEYVFLITSAVCAYTEPPVQPPEDALPPPSSHHFFHTPLFHSQDYPRRYQDGKPKVEESQAESRSAGYALRYGRKRHGRRSSRGQGKGEGPADHECRGIGTKRSRCYVGGRAYEGAVEKRNLVSAWSMVLIPPWFFVLFLAATLLTATQN